VRKTPTLARCRFIAADGAYQYLWMAEPLPMVKQFTLVKVVRRYASVKGETGMDEGAVDTRCYQRCGRSGKTWIFREVLS
jgi:hypothetical protein